MYARRINEQLLSENDIILKCSEESATCLLAELLLRSRFASVTVDVMMSEVQACLCV